MMAIFVCWSYWDAGCWKVMPMLVFIYLGIQVTIAWITKAFPGAANADCFCFIGVLTHHSHGDNGDEDDDLDCDGNFCFFFSGTQENIAQVKIS